MVWAPIFFGSSFFVSLGGFQSVLTSGITWSDSPNSIKNPAIVFMIPLSGRGTARDTTVSLSGAGVAGGHVVVKVATGDGGLVGRVGGGGVVVGGPEVGGPALEVVDGAYL